MSKLSTLTAVSEQSLFGAPPLLEGEDVAAYDELYGRVCAAVKPVDVIDEMLINDAVSQEWEILRWRRAKTNLIRRRTLKELERFLLKQLDYNDHYQEYFEHDLTQILQNNLPKDQPEGAAAALAGACARNEPDAVAKVNKLLDCIGKDMDRVLDGALARKAEDLANEYLQHKPAAVQLVDGLLAAAGASIDSVMLSQLTGQLDYIERIDRLMTLAENRRNACLREIDRRRALLGEALRRKVQEVEDGEFKVIETTQPKEKT
jgi:hypothetical protein